MKCLHRAMHLCLPILWQMVFNNQLWTQTNVSDVSRVEPQKVGNMIIIIVLSES